MSGITGTPRLLVVCEPMSRARELTALAQRLADAMGAEITLLGLTDDAVPARAAALLGEDAGARLVGETREALERVAGELTRMPGLVVREGRGFMQILGEAIHGDYTLVLKPAADRPGLHARLLGSTDQHLLRKCPVPLWLERPGQGRGGGVLVALDVDYEQADEAETLRTLNGEILALAGAVAEALDEPLHVAHAWDAPEESLLRRWPHDDDKVDAYVRSEESRHRARLEEASEQLDRQVNWGRRVVRHLRRGDPRDVLPRLAEELGARLVVMGTIARTGIPGLLIGNTAEDVLNDLRTALLTVKPPTFVCPVATPER